MGLQDLANLGEFVGGLVVIASLAYLAVQVRQNTQSIRTENYARALDRISALQAQMGRSETFSNLFSRGAADASLLSPQERLQFTWIAYEAFGAFEFMFHQARAGAMPDEVWERWSEATRWWLSFPGIRAWWASKPSPFSASFTAFVEESLGAAAEPTPDTLRWRDFVRGASRDASGPPAGTAQAP